MLNNMENLTDGILNQPMLKNFNINDEITLYCDAS